MCRRCRGGGVTDRYISLALVFLSHFTFCVGGRELGTFDNGIKMKELVEGKGRITFVAKRSG